MGASFVARRPVRRRESGGATTRSSSGDRVCLSLESESHRTRVGDLVARSLILLRGGAQSATIVAISTQSLRDVRDHLSEVIDRVEHQHDRVVVTRNGRPAAVILSPEDLAQLEETIDVLGDPQALADIREADAAYARGDVLRGSDAVRQLRL